MVESMVTDLLQDEVNELQSMVLRIRDKLRASELPGNHDSLSKGVGFILGWATGALLSQGRTPEQIHDAVDRVIERICRDKQTSTYKEN